MGVIASLVSGLAFGIGLIVSGMIDPAKVQNFVDVAGTWDPSLAFVMLGAIAVAAPGSWLVLKRKCPIDETTFRRPATTRIDGHLLAGAAIFGAGWGLAGLCPGPALASLPLAAPGTLVFVAAMVMGMALGAVLRAKRGSEESCGG